MTTASVNFPSTSHFLATIRDLFAAWFSAHETGPAQPLTAFEEAEQMRAMADDVLQSDPAFAHDLYAAADRHEMA